MKVEAEIGIMLPQGKDAKLISKDSQKVERNRGKMGGGGSIVLQQKRI